MGVPEALSKHGTSTAGVSAAEAICVTSGWDMAGSGPRESSVAGGWVWQGDAHALCLEMDRCVRVCCEGPPAVFRRPVSARLE